MEEVKKSLETREKYLSQLIKEKEKAISSSPEGFLRICCRREGKAQYYYRREPKDFNGSYIREKDFRLAQALAQKEYDQKVMRVSEKEQKTIRKFLADYPPICAEQIWERLHPARQKITSYEKSGIYLGENLILTYETKRNPLNQKLLLQKIKHYMRADF